MRRVLRGLWTPHGPLAFEGRDVGAVRSLRSASTKGAQNVRSVTRLRTTRPRRTAAQAAHCTIPTTIVEAATVSGRVTSGGSRAVD